MKLRVRWLTRRIRRAFSSADVWRGCLDFSHCNDSAVLSWLKCHSLKILTSVVTRLTVNVSVALKRHIGACALARGPDCSVCSGFPQQECVLGSEGNGTTETTRCVSTFSWEHELLRQTLGRRCFFCVCVCVRWIWKSCTCSTMESEMWTVSVKTRGESEASTFHTSRSIWDLTPNMAEKKKNRTVP